jgi:uncharacterized protein (TIGR02444 family)
MASANPFWRFSLRVYRVRAVQEACLALQDRCGADVNLLLFCGWTGQQGRRLDPRSLRLAIARVAGWQQEVIAPLRLARRGLKQQAACGAAPELAVRFRRRVAAIELDLERAEQSMLAELAAHWLPAAELVPPREAIEASLACYLRLLPVAAAPEDHAQLARIAQACSPRVTRR